MMQLRYRSTLDLGLESHIFRWRPDWTQHRGWNSTVKLYSLSPLDRFIRLATQFFWGEDQTCCKIYGNFISDVFPPILGCNEPCWIMYFNAALMFSMLERGTSRSINLKRSLLMQCGRCGFSVVFSCLHILSLQLRQPRKTGDPKQAFHLPTSSNHWFPMASGEFGD